MVGRRRIAAAEAPDTWFVKGAEPEEVVAAVVGRCVAAGGALPCSTSPTGRRGAEPGGPPRIALRDDRPPDRRRSAAIDHQYRRAERPGVGPLRPALTDGTELRVRDRGSGRLAHPDGPPGPDALTAGRDDVAAALRQPGPAEARLLTGRAWPASGTCWPTISSGLSTPGRRPRGRRGRRPPRRHPGGAGRPRRPGRQPHRRPAGGGGARRALPPRRRPDRAAPGRRADDAELPRPPAVTARRAGVVHAGRRAALQSLPAA